MSSQTWAAIVEARTRDVRRTLLAIAEARAAFERAIDRRVRAQAALDHAVQAQADALATWRASMRAGALDAHRLEALHERTVLLGMRIEPLRAPLAEALKHEARERDALSAANRAHQAARERRDAIEREFRRVRARERAVDEQRTEDELVDAGMAGARRGLPEDA